MSGATALYDRSKLLDDRATEIGIDVDRATTDIERLPLMAKRNGLLIAANMCMDRANQLKGDELCDRVTAREAATVAAQESSEPDVRLIVDVLDYEDEA
jgi:hypothetical protein